MDFVSGFLSADMMGTPAWLWLSFAGVVVTLPALDLGVLHKGDREIGARGSLLLSAGYIGVALLFGAGVWALPGARSGMDYDTGFMIGLGYRKLVLWTHRCLTAARAIYAARGFTMDRHEPYEGFGQQLVGEYWSLRLR